MPNYEDWSFIRVILDEKSLNFFRKNLHKIKDTLSKFLILRSLYDMVKDAKLRATDFIDSMIDIEFLKCNLGNSIMLQCISDYLKGSLSFIPNFYKSEYKEKLFWHFHNVLLTATDKNDIA